MKAKVDKRSPYPHLRTYNYIVSLQLRLQKAQSDAVKTVLKLLFRILFSITLVLFIFGLALFIFFIFHYLTLPTILHVLPVHLSYADCSRAQSEYCKYPTAVVPFIQRKRMGKESPLLMSGQKYAMWVSVDLPESEENAQAGIFMINIALRSYDENLLKSASRPALLQYRSYIHHLVRIIVLSPLYLMGFLQERQHLRVDLIDLYQEDPYAPVMDAVIEVRKSTVNIYSMELHVEARLEGLRYWMHRHPVIIGAIIVGINFFCGLILAGLSLSNRFARQNMKELPASQSTEDFGFDETVDPLETSEMEDGGDEVFVDWPADANEGLRHRKT
ncbi:seipin-like isoform X2 [Paramacrobiotus metropolitanus]|uniref:seipin-like isoform X2 n=1 Tax=Paramacrobiotus metropolitanus TaxID=2943436 RepID=UPI0024460D71|nr:seipin-like isoform X2 [Paramacrobiotus metropolitanus]